MESRKEMVFSTPEMECCLFLDPRFRRVIVQSREKSELAKKNIIDLWNKLKSLEETNMRTNENSNEANELRFTFDARAELNKMMGQYAEGNVSETLGMNEQNIDIEDALEAFQPDLLPSEKSVLDFWETQKDSPLYKVAMALYSVPPTQVRIEQNFSNVGHVFSVRRFRLSQELLEAILMIHLNRELFNLVKAEQLIEKKI